MAVSNTSRFGLPQWSEGTDPRPGRTDTNAFLRAIEEKAAMYVPSGPLTSRPTAGIGGRLFAATDQGEAGRLYYDTGTTWMEAGTVGGGGAGKAILAGPAVTASEGTSPRSARADHTHKIPMASSTAHGALSSEHYDLLAGATPNVVNNALLKRTSAGHVYLPASGQGSYDPVHKQYVDDATSDLRAATAAVTGGAVVRRWSSGHISGPTPTKQEFYATKGYVDEKNWHAADITAGELGGYRVRWSNWAYDTAQTGSVFTVSVNSDGRLMRFTSALKYKTNVQPYTADPRKLLAVEPVTFNRYDEEAPGGVNPHRELGVIADWNTNNLPEAVQYAPDPKTGQMGVEGWDTQSWAAAQQYLHRWNARRVDDLEERVGDLEDENDTLRSELKELREFYNDLSDRLLALEDPDA